MAKSTDKSTLSLEVEKGESIELDDGRIKIKFEEKSGRRIRLKINMCRSILLKRFSRDGTIRGQA